MSSKKKPSQEARERLSEKVGDVRLMSEQLHELIKNIVELPIARAEEVLKEKSKTKFLGKYSKVSTELEGCLNQLLLVTDAIASLDDSDESGDSDDADESDTQSTISVITNATTVTLEGFGLHETKYGSQESLTSVTPTHDSFHRSVSENENLHNNIPNDVSSPVNSNATLPTTENINESAINNVSPNEIKTSSPAVPLDVIPNETKCVEDSILTEEIRIEDFFPVLTDVIVESFKWELDIPYPVIVLNTFTPLHFYVQIVNPENDIMEQLYMHFLEEKASIGYDGGINYVPALNTFCCAKSASNGPWYRAKVVGIEDEPKAEVYVKVFFIDEGYEDFVTLLHIRPLYSKFATLPAQSLKCILGGVQPIEAAAQTKMLSFHECDEMWLPPSIAFFENLVKNGNICTSYFYFPPRITYDPPHNISYDTLVCDLYIISSGTKVPWWKASTSRLPIEDHIAFKMITQNMAAHCPFFHSEILSRNSMKVIEQYMKPQSPDVGVAVDIQSCTVNQEHDLKKDVGESKEVTKEIVEEERVPLPSSQRMVFQRAESLDNGVVNENLSRSFDENMNLNCASGKIAHETHSRKLSPVHKSINERQHQVIKSDPRSPADEKPAFKKNEKFFPTKKTSDSKTVIEPSVRTDITQEDSSVISAKQLKPPLKPPLKPLAWNTEYKYFKFGTSFHETVLAPEPSSGFAKVLVSEVINPGLFYVHFVTEEVVLLDKLMTELNIYYNEKANEIREYSKNEGYKYEAGNAIAVLYSDNMWYRALILSIRSTSEDEHEYEVLFVDYGSGEWLSQKCVLPIIEQFCEQPMKIIACTLADVKPCSNIVTKQIKGVSIQPAGFECPDYDSDNSQSDARSVIPKWPQQATDRVKELILTQLPMMVSLKTALKNSDGLYEVYLYDTADNNDVFINQLLVDECLASSEVLTKKVAPSVKISETELEQKIAEDNAMSEWDPMKEQFLSNRNVYSVDVDDAGVAALGYVQQKKSHCNNFLYRGHCYRGDSCKFVHALPGDPEYDAVEVFCDDTILDLPKPDRCVPVVIRAMLNPTHFWVNFPYGIDWDDEKATTSDNCGEETLEKLHQNMNLYYSKLGHSRKTNLSILAEGELIAARFHQDSQWYRARVINTADDLVQVFYVDYGNTDVITENDTNALLPDFLHLPFQAVECFLFNTYLEEQVTQQDERFVQMRTKFQDMVADKVLMAYVVSSSITKSLIVMLYDTSAEPHTYINDVVRSWDGIIPKDMNDLDIVKDSLLKDKNSPKISYIPG